MPRGEARRCTVRQWTRRGFAVAVAITTTTVLADWGATAWRDLLALSGSSRATPGDAIADVAAVLGLAAWAWLLLGAVATVVEATAMVSGRRLAPRIAPAGWRRLVLSAVGVGLLSAPAGVAQASPGDGVHVVSATFGPDRGTAAANPADAIRGLPLPDRPFGRLVAGPGADAERGPMRPPRPPARVTVRPGDSLWAIAERHLDPQASVQAIATEWRRWYAANRAGIGPDPNLIQPGMVLHAPARRAAS
jgi:LysM domain